MPVWLKEKLTSFAEKRHSSKCSPHCVKGLHKIGSLASEIKAKRESLAAKAGVPTTIADFVANSHLSWMATYLPRSARPGEKNRLWKPKKKSSKKTQLPPAPAAPSNSRNPAIGVSYDQPLVGQGIRTEEINAEDCSVVDRQQALDAMYRRAFTVILVVILSSCPLLEAKKVALRFATLAFVLFGVMHIGSQPRHSAASCLNLVQILNFVIASFGLFFNPTDKPSKFLEKPLANPESGLSQSIRCDSDTELGKQQHLPSALPPDALSLCETFMAEAEHPGTYPSPTKHSESIGNPSGRGIKKLRSKLLRKFVFRRASRAQNNTNRENSADLTTIVFSHPARACPASSVAPSETAEMGKGRMCCHSDFDIQKEARGESISQALEFRYSKSNTSSVNAEKLKINSKEKKCGRSSFLFLLAVVLFGLMAGRLLALACALCWCLFMKAVEFERKA